jgi:hypothetical protein
MKLANANRNAEGLVDFSRPTRKSAARLAAIRQKHVFFASIETLGTLGYGKKQVPGAFRHRSTQTYRVKAAPLRLGPGTLRQ